MKTSSINTVRGFAAVLALLAACAAFAAAKPRTDIDYELRPRLKAGQLDALEVTVSFRGTLTGETTLRLPDAWGGETESWKALSEWRVTGGTLSDGATPSQKIIRHRPRQRLIVRYAVRQDIPGVPAADRGHNYRPIVQPHYFHVIGQGAFAVPELGLPVARTQFRLRGLPPGWHWASDLEHRHAQPMTSDDIYESVIVGGDFEILRPLDRSATDLRLAVRGQELGFDPQHLVDQLARVMAGQRAFWGDPAEPYLVTILPLTRPNPGWTSINGTALRDSFAYFVTPSPDENILMRGAAHETMHTWIPFRVGLPTDGPDEPLGYWISEGFTDFYTNRLLVRTGVWSATDFASELNDVLKQYALSPERASPNTRIRDAFWTDRYAQKLPYQRGLLFAMILDQKIRLQTAGAKDLDDVMLDMRAATRRSPRLPPLETALRQATATVNISLDELIARHVVAGEPIVLPADLLAPCGTIETMPLAPFSRGFDNMKTQANGMVIVGVDPTSNAFKAGMRDGMKLVRREGGELGNSSLEIAYHVIANGAEKVIRYYPVGVGPAVPMQKLVLRQDATEASIQECRDRMAGIR